ncbi:hypothetical protein JUJ52_17660 [Virgibacillus sp. AGTR]|uniref:hypothetical protein n=1 Tax=Virgibacillus sp. AGTR TaxID=2812055 RepID=UPI001D1623C4|nr:hypothetical protein [Virgibacillus sp. AGTR]MCC2251777.1 hypothetical protein [Virgibacillus sp. AGTR]
MLYVELVNRSYLESELERYGVIEIVEVVIERLRDEVIHLASNVYEQFIIDTKVFVGNVFKTFTATFAMLESEDPPEVGSSEDEFFKYVEFISLYELEKE